jgi:hypothetical protein
MKEKKIKNWMNFVWPPFLATLIVKIQHNYNNNKTKPRQREWEKKEEKKKRGNFSGKGKRLRDSPHQSVTTYTIHSLKAALNLGASALNLCMHT